VVATVTTLEVETARRNKRAAETLAGSTIRNIAAALRMETEAPQTSLAVRREETRFPIGRLVHGNRLADRAEIWPAVAAEELVRATGSAEMVSVTELVVQALATGLVEAERIAPEAETSLEAVAETATRLGVAREARRATTDRARAPAAAAVLRVWDLEEVVAAGGVDNRPRSRQGSHRGAWI
jgi:hypothetical protein